MAEGSAAISLTEIVARHAQERPHALALTWLEQGERQGRKLTRGELLVAGQGVAASLQARGLRPGERAILAVPTGIDAAVAMLGCLLAGVAAVPVPAPEPGRPRRALPRLRSVVASAAPGAVLSTSETLPALRALEVPGLEAVAWVACDRPGDAGAFAAPRIGPQTLAWLQYTSGSLSDPKGVQIRHRHILHHCDAMYRCWRYGPDSRALAWMPYFHDYGLVEGLILPLWAGIPAWAMAPADFVAQPLRWLRAMDRHGISHSSGPNFAFEHCLRSWQAGRQRLDLGRLVNLGNGGEPVHAETMVRFQQALAPHGLRPDALCPSYGLAEGTLVVACKGSEPLRRLRFSTAALRADRAVPATTDEGTVELVSCGRPVPGMSVRIVSPSTGQPLAEGHVGEIEVRGPSVADGYWGAPEGAESTFPEPGGQVLRTGDLGFLHEGELVVTGRHKDLVIIRGQNHYPRDLELTVGAAHPALRTGCAAAFSLTADREARLVVVQQVEREAADTVDRDLPAIVQAAQSAMAAEHQLALDALILVGPGGVPRTSSGKIQRPGCRGQLLAGTLPVLARWRSAALAGRIPGAAAPAAKRLEDPTGNDSGIEVDPRHRSDAASVDRADRVIAWLRSWSERGLDPELYDERRSLPPHVLLDLGEHGLFGLLCAREHGGLGLRTADALRVIEQLSAIDVGLGMLVMLHATLGTRTIDRYALPALRARWLPRLATGRQLAAFAMTEPDAGAHIGAITATASPDPRGGWLLRGHKRWTGAAWAGVTCVFVQLLDADGRGQGLTGFAVERGATGLELGPEVPTLGLRNTVQGGLRMHDVRVPAGALLGEAGGGGELARDILGFGRIGTAAVALGALRRAIQLTLRYASRRTIATGLLLDDPVLRGRLGRSAAAATAIDALLDCLAGITDAGETVPLEVSAALKVVASDAAWVAADGLVQALGGRGFMEQNLAPRLLRDVRALRIGEGPNESLTAFVGRGARHTRRVQSFLAGPLAGPDIARRLDDHLGDVHRSRDPAASGELVQWALVLAALRTLRAESCPWSECWAEDGLRGAAARARRPREAPTADELRAWAEGLEARIGDIEFHPPGVDHGLDPLLARDRTAAAATARQGTQAEAEAESARQAPKILALLRDWVAGERDVPADDSLPLVAHGIDSVQAAGLAVELEAVLGRAPEAAWLLQPISLRELASRLASSPVEQGSAVDSHGELTARVEADPAGLLSEIDRLSPSQVEQLLATLDGDKTP